MNKNDERTYIFVCSGSDCKKKGCKEIVKILKDQIKSKKAGRKFKVIKTKCMDQCKRAPNLIVDNNMCHKVEAEDIKELI